MDSGLLIVDVQNDFCRGGALAVEGGDEVAVPLSELASVVSEAGGTVVASRDWHPPATKHFQAWGGPWPPHCVQGTKGAEFHPDLNLPPGASVVSAGTTFFEDGYSSFEGRTDEGKPLARLLHEGGVRKLYVGGIATDYCVRASALDARKEGLEVALLTDAIRAVDVRSGDGERAIREMLAAGVELTTTGRAMRELARTTEGAHP